MISNYYAEQNEILIHVGLFLHDFPRKSCIVTASRR